MRGRYDVAIIGAGPAGLACAETLAGAGCSVLVIERQKVIGPKPCAGALSRLMPVDLVPPSALRFDEQIIEVKGKCHRLRLETPRFTVSRETLASFQLAKIANGSNIEFLLGSRAILLDRYTVATDDGSRFSAGMVVGADGAFSSVRRFLGLPTERTLAVYREVRAVSGDYLLVLDAHRWGSGYLWSFPHRDLVNVGCYFDPAKRETRRMVALLVEEIGRRFPNAPAGPLRSGWIPVAYHGVEHGNLFLAGDAAGLAFRATGEGISAAVVSGREIARRILDPAYPMPELARIVAFKKKQEWLFSLLERFPAVQDVLYSLFLVVKRFPAGQRLLEQ